MLGKQDRSLVANGGSNLLYVHADCNRLLFSLAVLVGRVIIRLIIRLGVYDILNAVYMKSVFKADKDMKVRFLRLWLYNV